MKECTLRGRLAVLWVGFAGAATLVACNDTQLSDFFSTAVPKPLTVVSTFGQLDGDLITGTLRHYVTVKVDPFDLAIRTPSTGCAKFVSDVDGIPNCIVLKPKARYSGTSMEGLDDGLPRFKDVRIVIGNLDSGTALKDDIVDLQINSAGEAPGDAPTKADAFLAVSLTTKEEDWPYLDVYAEPEVSGSGRPWSEFGIASGSELMITAYEWEDTDGDDVDENGERNFVNPLPYLSKITALETKISRQAPAVDLFFVEDSTSAASFAGATPFPLDFTSTASAGVLGNFIRFQFSLDEFGSADPSGPSVIPYEISYELERVDRVGAVITPIETVSRGVFHCNELRPTDSTAVRDALYATLTDTGTDDFFLHVPANTTAPAPTDPPAENVLSTAAGYVLDLAAVGPAGRVFPGGDYRITLTLRDALSPEPPAEQVSGHFEVVEGPTIEITEILGLRSATVGDFSQQADPNVDGRIFVDTQETWGGGALDSAHYDKQRVKLTVEVGPSALSAASHKVRWEVTDPDDPAGHADVDASADGGDNTGTVHEADAHWFSMADQPISSQVDRAAVDHTTIIGEAKTDLATVGGVLTSTVFLNFSDDGGDNYIVSAFLEETGVGDLDSDQTGTLTVWRKRFLTVNTMTKPNDDVQANAVGSAPGVGSDSVTAGPNAVSDTLVFGGDDTRSGEDVIVGANGVSDTAANSGGVSYDPGVLNPVQTSVRTGYADTTDPDRNCYLDIVSAAGVAAMTFQANVPTADYTQYLEDEVHAMGASLPHPDNTYAVDSIGEGDPLTTGDSTHDPHSFLFLRTILDGEVGPVDEISDTLVHELGHSIAPEGTNIHTIHSAPPNDDCAGAAEPVDVIHWCPKHTRTMRDNATRSWDDHDVADANPAETASDS